MSNEVFRNELAGLLNRYGVDAKTQVPDLFLADFLMDCMRALRKMNIGTKEFFTPFDGNTILQCPKCGGPHFNVTAAKVLVCSNVSPHTNFEIKSGGCGWNGRL